MLKVNLYYVMEIINGAKNVTEAGSHLIIAYHVPQESSKATSLKTVSEVNSNMTNHSFSSCYV